MIILAKKNTIMGQIVQEVRSNQYKINLFDNWDCSYIVDKMSEFAGRWGPGCEEPVYLENDVVTVYGRLEECINLKRY